MSVFRMGDEMNRTDAERLQSWFLALVLAGESPEEAAEHIAAIVAEEAAQAA